MVYEKEKLVLIIHPSSPLTHLETFELIAKTAQGLEEILAAELEQLGAQVTHKGNRSVSFMADKTLMYLANLHLRTAFRLMLPINTFNAINPDELYRNALKTPWEDYFSPNQTFAVQFTINSPHFTHSQYAALKLKDAIADRFRKQYNNVRPSVNTHNPDFLIQLHIHNTRCTLLIDSSGETLHKRGYRTQQVAAPLNEVLAAGLVLLSGWEGNTPFFDPMCGSGTIAIEAALYQRNIAPGLFRPQFGFQKWRNFDATLWKSLQSDALKNSRPSPPNATIYAADVLQHALKIAITNAQNAGLPDISFFTADFVAQPRVIKEKTGTLITNPPYGERLAPAELNMFYKAIGDKLKKNYTGFNAWILSSNLEALKHIGLHPYKKITLYNGPLACKFLQFKMY